MTPKEIADAIGQAMEGATAGPWDFQWISPADGFQYGATITGAEIDGGGRPVVADLPPRTTHGTHQANAEYIAACNPAHLRTLLADYKRQSELLEEAMKLASMIMECITVDVTMQGPRVTGVNGSAVYRASKMACSFVEKLEAHKP